MYLVRIQVYLMLTRKLILMGSIFKVDRNRILHLLFIGVFYSL